MTSPQIPQLPPSFDPAVFLHSDLESHSDPVILPSSCYLDDLEALQQQQEEVVAAKTKQGVVIQHRAWKLGEAFRSEEDYQLGSHFFK